jgi:DNA (cytosine-5)-methyltransferase 1
MNRQKIEAKEHHDHIAPMAQPLNQLKTHIGVSLFSGAGIGDLGFKAAGIRFEAMCEIEPDRAALLALNFTTARLFQGDINQVGPDLVVYVKQKLAALKEELFLLSCTAPCQGMSKNGQGTLLSNIRKGKRPSLDPRNRLILPALETIRAFRPLWVVFENVLEMRNTVIENQQGKLQRILDIIRDNLGDEYEGEAYDVEFADYGVPQRRQRLITIYTRDETAKRLFRMGVGLLPSPTHSRTGGEGKHRWISVSEALVAFPPLDAKDAKSASYASIPFHRVPLLDKKKYKWIQHTPLCCSAFDNQCISPTCRYTGNTNHGSSHGADGINRAHKTTPLYCEKCGSLLPRPYTENPDGSLRIMSGYTSAYKRMDSDCPAPTLTRNLSYACSDQKVHPTQNRVLSLAEAMSLQTINKYDYLWGPMNYKIGARSIRSELAADALIRLVIGESVPPYFLHQLGEHITALSCASNSPQE